MSGGFPDAPPKTPAPAPRRRNAVAFEIGIDSPAATCDIRTFGVDAGLVGLLRVGAGRRLRFGFLFLLFVLVPLVGLQFAAVFVKHPHTQADMVRMVRGIVTTQ